MFSLKFEDEVWDEVSQAIFILKFEDGDEVSQAMFSLKFEDEVS